MVTWCQLLTCYCMHVSRWHHPLPTQRLANGFRDLQALDDCNETLVHLFKKADNSAADIEAMEADQKEVLAQLRCAQNELLEAQKQVETGYPWCRPCRIAANIPETCHVI